MFWIPEVKVRTIILMHILVVEQAFDQQSCIEHVLSCICVVFLLVYVFELQYNVNKYAVCFCEVCFSDLTEFIRWAVCNFVYLGIMS